MLSYLKNIIDLDDEKISSIIHIGAGQCTELDTYLKANPERVVLVEALPAIANSLRETTEGMINVDVVEALITLDETPVKLNLYNDDRFHSIALLESLYSQFNNLEKIDTAEVSQFQLDDLMTQYSLSKNKFNILVIEVLGIEYELLKQANSYLFDFLIVKVPSSTVIENIENYDLIYKDGDLFFKELVYKKNQVNKLLKEAEEKETELITRISNLEFELEERTKQRDEEYKWHHENKNRAESLNKKVEQLEMELADKSRSVSLGQKMLSKAQVDLDHLRLSYEKKVKSEKELVELISELREKLVLASKYYIKLQLEHPELLSPTELN